MVVKTSDKSLHLIVGGRKVWTRQEGLAGVAKWAIGKATEKVPDKSSHEVMMTNPVSQFVGRIARQVGALVEGTSKLVELGKKLTSKTYVKSKQARVEDKNYLFVLSEPLMDDRVGSNEVLEDVRVQGRRRTNRVAARLSWES